MKHTLSILIPTYNDPCRDLVTKLQRQAERCVGLCYEILVGDDGSDNAMVIETNSAVELLPHCRIVKSEENMGRAAIRNFLAEQARHEWLLYIDSGVDVGEHFVNGYLGAIGGSDPVVCGGVSVAHDDARWSRSLRYKYECASEKRHSAYERSLHPYRSFRTTNFLIRRDIALTSPFESAIKSYGYEDVLFGKALSQNSVSISHIDNPVTLTQFEDNARYLQKIEESLRTLHEFSAELEGFSRLLAFSNRLGWGKGLVRAFFKLTNPMLRRNLKGNRPSLKLFRIYELGYFLTLRT